MDGHYHLLGLEFLEGLYKAALVFIPFASSQEGIKQPAFWHPPRRTSQEPRPFLSVIQSKTRCLHAQACCGVCDELTTDGLLPAYGIIKMEPPLLHDWLLMLLQNSLIAEVMYPVIKVDNLF